MDKVLAMRQVSAMEKQADKNYVIGLQRQLQAAKKKK
jgi:hypothetical protein